MTRSMRCLAALACIFVAGCAGPTVVDEARSRFNDGRGDEALALLQQAVKQNPNDLAARGEYFRLRELLVAQWLAQAEMLRQAGQHEAAEARYRGVLAHDAANARAAEYAESARKIICQFPDSEIKRALLWAPDFVIAREK